MDYLKQPELVAKVQNYFGVNRKLKQKDQEYTIENRFWYYLFLFGTALGDETFYSAFIPFWFWNIDGAVGRRFVLVWSIVMYTGQLFKDIIQWPRPGPPVIRLHNKWALEYGMPSTHAMVGVSIPFSIILYTMDRYQYNIPLGISISVLWCTIICVSRLYLGMHTVLDVIAGVILSILIMFPMVPLVDAMDNYLLTSPSSPLLLIVSSLLILVYYPNSGKWTPTRGDTAMIIGVTVGILVGSWTNYQSGIMKPSELTAPYAIMWPSYTMFGCLILRTIIGFVGVVLTKKFCNYFTYNFLCALLREDVDSLKKSENTLQNKHKTFVELSCKYVFCGMIGFNTMYVIPQLFRFLRIERPTFFTEI
ncbi:unnamed protein product [Psylliodes chrysocephalus]|uniref:Phosphatidic acid phosphatase type 2/haloperoxidase domain-containing protein n=1 Tax=Psylliodes chrysocephalus TaxID=3402493 RepID=A0A9P0CN37_9CUCU|nr:unnamed protein product [Psylliodes chrysocephala]